MVRTTTLCPPVAYLGPRSDHRAVLEQLMAAAGAPLTCLDDSLAAGAYTGASRFGRAVAGARRAVAQVRGRAPADHLDRLTAAVDAAGVRCVLAFWGTNPLADAIALKRRRPGLKVVLNVLCHPLALTPLRIGIQNRLMRRAARWLDGFVFPSRAMREYFARDVFTAPRPAIVIPPYLPADAHPSESVSPVDCTPNLVFLGRMDWSSAQPSDNVGGLLDALLDRGVHVFHHATAAPVRPHPRRHTFEYRPLNDVVRLCPRFQATLVAYNTAACSRDVRFRVTVPDRLVAGVAAGLPVFLPRSGYDACWEYLAGYPAAIPFDTPDDIRRVLNNGPGMAGVKAAAWAARGPYTAEAHLDRLLEFLTSVTDARPTR